MDYKEFVDWLMIQKGMGSRSAHDVLSRCNRVLKLMEASEIDKVTVDDLIGSAAFQCCSVFIKSQLKRAVVLVQEFVSSQGDMQ